MPVVAWQGEPVASQERRTPVAYAAALKLVVAAGLQRRWPAVVVAALHMREETIPLCH